MYEKYRLSNGVRVVAEKIPYAYSAVIGIWIRTGSRFEQTSNQGVSHFLEHLFFKGTTKRSAKEIAEELEALGGSLNAFTAKEYTCLYAKVLAEHLPVAIDLLSDMFFNSLFSEADIEKERNVILEEIKMYEDTPDELIHDLFAANVWQPHPLGYPILGSVESVRGIDRKVILDYYHQHYTPENVVISIAGNIDYQEVFSVLENIFGHWSASDKGRQTQDPPIPKSGEAYYHKDTEQVHLCLGAPSISQEDERIYAMIVLNCIIGGGLSSRLFQEIREERGLVYSIYSYHSSYIDTGLFSIYAGTGVDNTEEVVGLVLQELSQIREKGITEEELVRVREQIKGNILLSMESISNRMSRLGRSEVCYNRIITSEEIVAGITSVTLEEVQSLAEYLFQRNNLTLTAIGPKGLELDFSRLMTETLF